MGGMSYPSTEKQSVYSTAPADWAINIFKIWKYKLAFHVFTSLAVIKSYIAPSGTVEYVDCIYKKG